MTGLIATIGDNNPPSEAEIISQRLRDEHEPLLAEARGLIERAKALPERIESDEQAGELGDYIKEVNASRKKLESTRVKEKQPHLDAGKTIDGFFKTPDEYLDKAKRRAQMPLDTYLKEQAEAERQRRIAEAEAQRIEAQRLAKEAYERAEAERLAREAAEAANKPAPTAPSQAEQVFVQAQVAEQKAATMEQKAEARPAQLASARGFGGSRTSLRTVWRGSIVDRRSLDIATLFPYISDEALQKALNAYVQAGGRTLAGAIIKEESEAVVR
jgi:hypothetical protein